MIHAAVASGERGRCTMYTEVYTRDGDIGTVGRYAESSASRNKPKQALLTAHGSYL